MFGESQELNISMQSLSVARPIVQGLYIADPVFMFRSPFQGSLVEVITMKVGQSSVMSTMCPMTYLRETA